MKKTAYIIALALAFCMSFNIIAFADYETSVIPLGDVQGNHDYETEQIPIDTPPAPSSDTKKTTAPTSTTKAKKITVKATSVTKLIKGKQKITVSWKKVKGVKGYQIQLATNKKFSKNKKTVNIKSQKTVKKTVTKLKAKRTYYVRVRAYKMNGKKKVYSKWSAVKTIKTK